MSFLFIRLDRGGNRTKKKRSVIPEKRQRKAKSKKSLVANSYNSRLPLMNEPIGMTDLFPNENSPDSKKQLNSMSFRAEVEDQSREIF